MDTRSIEKKKKKLIVSEAVKRFDQVKEEEEHVRSKEDNHYRVIYCRTGVSTPIWNKGTN